MWAYYRDFVFSLSAKGIDPRCPSLKLNKENV